MTHRSFVPVSETAIASAVIRQAPRLAGDCDGDCGQGDCDCSSDCDDD